MNNSERPVGCTLYTWLFACLVGVVSGAAADNEIVIINGDRIFTVDEFTEYFSDGDGVDAKFFQQVGTGKPASFNVKSGANEDLTEGLLERIELLNEVRGPVTTTRPLTVFRQSVVITDRTVVRNLPDGLAGLEEGDEVEVSGFTARTNVRRATRLSGQDDGANDWLLTGFVSEIIDDGFRVGFQPVRFNGINVEDCDGPLSRGDFVEIRATPDPTYLKSLTLQTATSIRCVSRRVDGPPGVAVPATIDGFVTAVIDDDTFTVAQQLVRLTDTTEFRNGEREGVEVGVRVEVQGALDPTTRELTARSVEFQEVRIRIVAPLSPDAVVPGVSITLLGLTLNASPATEDPTGILTLGLSRPTQAEAQGFRDADGTLVLTRIRAAGPPDPNNAALRGPVAAIARPTLEVLGISVDTSSAVFQQGDTPIDADTFFSLIRIGAQVGIDDATFDESSGILAAGVVTLYQINGGTGAGLSGDGRGAGIGTVTLAQDCVFVSGFEDEKSLP